MLAELNKRAEKRDQDSLIHLETLQKVLKVKGENFAGHLFSALDTDNRGYVTDDQLVSTLLDLQVLTHSQRTCQIPEHGATAFKREPSTADLHGHLGGGEGQ